MTSKPERRKALEQKYADEERRQRDAFYIRTLRLERLVREAMGWITVRTTKTRKGKRWLDEANEVLKIRRGSEDVIEEPK